MEIHFQTSVRWSLHWSDFRQLVLEKRTIGWPGDGVQDELLRSES